MTVGIIASSNGGVFKTVVEILKKSAIDVNFFVITDRACGIEEYCENNLIDWVRIENDDNQLFSQLSADYFKKQGGMDVVFLFFLRLVTSEVFSQFPTINIHPSLLPLFAGFSPIEKTIKSKSKFIGVTAHLADESVDGGAFVVQGVSPVTNMATEKYHKISYLQKVYVMLVVLNQLLEENLQFDLTKFEISFSIKPDSELNFNPKLTNKNMIIEFAKIEDVENITITKR